MFTFATISLIYKPDGFRMLCSQDFNNLTWSPHRRIDSYSPAEQRQHPREHRPVQGAHSHLHYNSDQIWVGAEHQGYSPMSLDSPCSGSRSSLSDPRPATRKQHTEPLYVSLVYWSPSSEQALFSLRQLLKYCWIDQDLPMYIRSMQSKSLFLYVVHTHVE